MRKALITGILGQDGTYLARWLVKKGFEVHGLSVCLSAARRNASAAAFLPKNCPAFIFTPPRLEDPFSIAAVLQESNPDEVYHLAGVSDSRQSFLMPEQSLQSITVGTLRIAGGGAAAPSRSALFSGLVL